MRNVQRIFLAVSIFPGLPFLTAIGGVFAVCHRSALNPMNFFLDGQCHASDTPNEVFIAFLMLGSLVAVLLILVVLVASFLNWIAKEGQD